MRPAFLLKNVRILNPRESFIADVRIRDGCIQEIDAGLREKSELVLDGEGLVACPGLINSHDHLQFNLYPRIGRPPYNNAYEWGKDIFTNHTTVVRTIESVPVRLRYLWGAWKNLFSGVTFVVHHDPASLYFRFLFPVDVLHRYTFAHSIGNEPQLVQKLDARKSGTPFVIHLAEGKDDSTAREVEQLRNMGGLDERTAAIHAINLAPSDVDILKQTGASIVWCPSSNMFLFHQTTPIHLLFGRVPVALGTDSTLTGSTTMFDEMRSAKETSGLTPQEIFSLVTEHPQKMFRLSPDNGTITIGGQANLFLVRDKSSDPYQTILESNPGDILLLLRNGRPVFHDPDAFPQLKDDGSNHVLRLNNRVRHIHHRQFFRLYRKLRPYLKHYQYLSSAN
ncbi:MAG: amidohydrolase [Bacteroidetes bacterium]|nr:amidohydrolase [Bacteroidota bacterium]